MRSLILMILSIVLIACAAAQPKVRMSAADGEMAFTEALERAEGKKARAAVAAGLIDPARALRMVEARMLDLVRTENIEVARHLAQGYGIPESDRRRIAENIFSDLIKDAMCVRAAAFAKSFKLEKRFGEEAVDCVRNTSAVQAAAIVCTADVNEEYRLGLIRQAAKTLEGLTPLEAVSGMGTLLESDCPMPEAIAARWFPASLGWPATLWHGRSVLEKAVKLEWAWDLQTRYRAFLAAAIGFKDEDQVKWVMNESSFRPEPADFAVAIAHFIDAYRCEDAVMIIVRHRLPIAEADALFALPKCSGTSFTGIFWRLDKTDARPWFDLSMNRGRYALARHLCENLQPADSCAAKVETAALAAGDFDAAMEFNPLGETKESLQDRILESALAHGEEWFVIRWSSYAAKQMQILPARRDGWIERAFLHALFRKEWKSAAECIAEHGTPAVAEAGKRLAFEEALLALDADTAIDLAKRYKLGADPSTRAAQLKFKQIQERERKKAGVKKPQQRDADWRP
jgi:hypothetical protein